MAMVLFKPEGIAGIWQAWRSARRPARRVARRGVAVARRRRCMALFEASGLPKRFGDQVVLQDITLAFEEGELSGIMGPNGAGKTTCFNVLTGRYKPDRGSVHLRRRGHHRPARRGEIARRGISRSFQVMNLFDDYSALDNVLIALPRVRRARLRRLARPARRLSAAQDAAARCWRASASRARSASPAKSLSYGERRALEIGVALAAEPRLLFLDEPTAGLGAEGTARLAELVARAASGTLTIVIIEHDMRFLFGLADRISVHALGPGDRRAARPTSCATNAVGARSNLGARMSAR